MGLQLVARSGERRQIAPVGHRSRVAGAANQLLGPRWANQMSWRPDWAPVHCRSRSCCCCCCCCRAISCLSHNNFASLCNTSQRADCQSRRLTLEKCARANRSETLANWAEFNQINLPPPPLTSLREVTCGVFWPLSPVSIRWRRLLQVINLLPRSLERAPSGCCCRSEWKPLERPPPATHGHNSRPPESMGDRGNDR